MGYDEEQKSAICDECGAYTVVANKQELFRLGWVEKETILTGGARAYKLLCPRCV